MSEHAAVTTFLFTDIEGSTRLWEQEPERMRRALAAHDALARDLVARSNGAVVKTTGDGMYAVFDDPVDALDAAVKLQVSLLDPQSTGGLPLRVRCGLHAGVNERRDNDFFGHAVNRAARIMSAGHGGQILLSSAVVALVQERLPREVRLRDLGRVHLRDMTHPEELYQVLHPALRDAFPPLRSLAATPNNLPQEVTSFVGRERELAQARALLGATRMLTLTGAGGLGKTRLSIHLAAAVLDSFPDGAWFVELAPISDPQRVPEALASALGVKEDAGRPVLEAVLKFVADRRLLVILDNCEHVVQACAELVRALLQAGPGVTILASSRERLHVSGECVLEVPALAGARGAARGVGAVRAGVRRGAAVSRSRARGAAVVRDHGRQCRECGRDLSPARRHPARHRARGRTRAEPERSANRAPPRRSLPSAHRRRSHGDAAPAHVARAHRLELRPPDRARARGVPAACGVRRRLDARGCGGGARGRSDRRRRRRSTC